MNRDEKSRRNYRKERCMCWERLHWAAVSGLLHKRKVWRGIKEENVTENLRNVKVFNSKTRPGNKIVVKVMVAETKMPSKSPHPELECFWDCHVTSWTLFIKYYESMTRKVNNTIHPSWKGFTCSHLPGVNGPGWLVFQLVYKPQNTVHPPRNPNTMP